MEPSIATEIAQLLNARNQLTRNYTAEMILSTPKIICTKR